MKLVAPFLLVALAATFLTACNTVNTRRDLYSPNRGGGYWTKKLDRYEGEEGLAGVSKPESHQHPVGHAGRDEGLFGISHPTRSRTW